MDDVSGPEILATGVMVASFSLVEATGGLGFGVDLVTAISLSSMLSVIHASDPVPTVRVATAPWLLSMNRAGSSFNTPIFPSASSSACKLSSIPLSGSPERTATRTHRTFVITFMGAHSFQVHS